MKTLLIAIIFVLFGSNAFSQLDSSDKAFIRNNTIEYIYNHVYKNIAAYNIRYGSNWFNGLSFNDRLRYEIGSPYDMLMPDYGYKIKMDIEKLDSFYPNPRYHLYKIYLKDFSWVPDDPKRGEISSHYIISTDNFLIALNEGNGDIKYISGQFFQSFIWDDFHLDIKDPLTFIYYLTLRSFNVGGGNIKFKKKTHKQLIFDGYSNIFKKPIIITVDKKEIDPYHITVKAK